MTAAPNLHPCPGAGWPGAPACGRMIAHTMTRCEACWAAHHRAPLTVSRGGAPSVSRPTPDDDRAQTAREMAQQHFADAVERVHTGYRGALHWHIPALQTAIGPIARGDLFVAGARTGNGKTLLFNNAFDAWVTDPDERHVGMYVGTEQAPAVLKTKLACARACVSARLVLKPEKWEVGTPAHVEAQDACQAELRVINDGEYAERAIFPDLRRISTAEMVKYVRIARKRYGVTFVVIDHVDRMDVGPGKNGAHEMNEIVVAAKELAVDLDIQMLLASQVKRSMDPLAQVIPPDVDDFAGSSGKEREADVAVAVSRVLDPDADPEALKQVRLRQRNVRDVWLPNVCQVVTRKHRVDNARLGAVALLDVAGHRLLERSPRDQYRTARFP